MIEIAFCKKNFSNRTCHLCGNIYLPTSSSQKYCPPCQKEMQKKWTYNYQHYGRKNIPITSYQDPPSSRCAWESGKCPRCNVTLIKQRLPATKDFSSNAEGVDVWELRCLSCGWRG